MTNAIAVAPSLAMAGEEQSPTLTLSGGGNILLVHLGALHRLYELGCLDGMKICGARTDFTAKEAEVLDYWNKRAKTTLDKTESLADAFGTPLRNLHKKRWWRSLADRTEPPKDWRATLSRPHKDHLSWGSKDRPVDGKASLHISAERHEEMKKLALSPQYVSELGMDYLIDWGYVLCDAALSRHGVGTTPKEWPSVSPNRLFYRSFEHVREASALRGVSSEMRAEEDKAMVRPTDVGVPAA